MVWIALAGLALAQEEAAVEVAPAPLPLPLVFSEDHTWVEVTPVLAGERILVREHELPNKRDLLRIQEEEGEMAR